jgi:hypothetical protein
MNCCYLDTPALSWYGVGMDTNSPIFTAFDDAVKACMQWFADPEDSSKMPLVVITEPNQQLVMKDCVLALVLKSGNVNRAARLLGIRRMRLQDWIDFRPEVQACLIDLRDEKIDDIIEGQYNAALMGDLNTGRFILQTVGKERGYVMRTETTGKDGAPIAPPTIDYSKLSDVALRELKAATETPDA